MKEFFNDLHTYIEQTYHRCLISFFEYKENKDDINYEANHFGTGFILEREDECKKTHFFIITAAHVVEDAKHILKNIKNDESIKIYCAIANKNEDVYEYMMLDFSSLNFFIFKNHDIAFADVTEKISKNDKLGFQPLSYDSDTNSLQNNQNNLDGICCFFGLLPSNNSYSSYRKKTKIVNYKFNWNMTVSRILKGHYNYNGIDLPILLEFNNKDLISRENMLSGNYKSNGAFADLAGMSGSPFFTFFLNKDKGRVELVLTGVLVEALPNSRSPTKLVASELIEIVKEIDNYLTKK